MKIKVTRKKKKCYIINLANEIEKVFNLLNSTSICDDHNK